MEHGMKRDLQVSRRCICPIDIIDNIFKIDSPSRIILAFVKHTYIPCSSSLQPLNSLHHSVSMLSLPTVYQSITMPRKKLKDWLVHLFGTHHHMITISLITLLFSENKHGDQHLRCLSFSIFSFVKKDSICRLVQIMYSQDSVNQSCTKLCKIY